MLTLAVPVANPLPNQLNRCRLAQQPIDHGSDDDATKPKVFTIFLFVFHGGSGVGVQKAVQVANGACTVLRKAVAPLTFDGLVTSEGAPVNVPTGYDQIAAILAGPGNKAAKNDAILSALLAMGVLSADFAGVVS